MMGMGAGPAEALHTPAGPVVVSGLLGDDVAEEERARRVRAEQAAAYRAALDRERAGVVERLDRARAALAAAEASGDGSPAGVMRRAGLAAEVGRLEARVGAVDAARKAAR